MKKIDLEDDFITNINIILDFYKKEKYFYKNLLLFYTEYKLQKKNLNNISMRKCLLKKDYFY